MAKPSEQALRIRSEVVVSEHAVRYTFEGSLTRRMRAAIERKARANGHIQGISWSESRDALTCVVKRQRGGKPQPVQHLEMTKRTLLHDIRKELDGLQEQCRGTGQSPLPIRQRFAAV